MKHLFRRGLYSFSLCAFMGMIFITLHSGCAKHNTTAVFSKPVTDFSTILYSPWNPTKKVCVLPFENLSKESDADLKVMEIFLTELFSAGIFEDIVDPVQANAALLGLRIRKPDSLDKETIKALGERLEVQYLILGTVADYSYGKNKGSAAQVGLNVRMIDVDTGNILWTGNCYKDGSISLGRIFGFTDGPNPAELGKEACQHIITSLQQQISKSNHKKSSVKAEKAETSEKAQKTENNEKEQIVTIEDSIQKRR